MKPPVGRITVGDGGFASSMPLPKRLPGIQSSHNVQPHIPAAKIDAQCRTITAGVWSVDRIAAKAVPHWVYLVPEKGEKPHGEAGTSSQPSGPYRRGTSSHQTRMPPANAVLQSPRCLQSPQQIRIRHSGEVPRSPPRRSCVCIAGATMLTFRQLGILAYFLSGFCCSHRKLAYPERPNADRRYLCALSMIQMLNL